MDELRQIPGPWKTEENPVVPGCTTIDSLKDAGPKEMYKRACSPRGRRIDRCRLYVCRCAVYFALTKNPSLEKLKWKNGGFRIC